jgi:hypothetical protein
MATRNCATPNDKLRTLGIIAESGTTPGFLHIHDTTSRSRAHAILASASIRDASCMVATTLKLGGSR